MGRNKDKNSRRSRAARKKAAQAAKRVVERFPDLGPNGLATRRQDRFRPFCGPSSIGHEMTCAGRLMLVGAFDGQEAKPDAILDALQRYECGYWHNYGATTLAMSDHGRVGRSSGRGGKYDMIPDDPSGDWFDETDKLLRDAGHQARMAVHSVTVDLHWFPDDDAPWAARIINSRVMQKRTELLNANADIPSALSVNGELASDSDWAMLALLIFGAMSLDRAPKFREQNQRLMRSAA